MRTDPLAIFCSRHSAGDIVPPNRFTPLRPIASRGEGVDATLIAAVVTLSLVIALAASVFLLAKGVA